ncbi:hypothetical protein B0H15DRAFT_87495 [Mycena belliarum]|uniref:Uncharacterized protein n=1 Tax=Mycena belliarum TaxID=1033014 RepID=A0AAD6XIE6_9AGAR|nr:hypothetical protein B0H15DRAFT_87495 [Mycena belliae]
MFIIAVLPDDPLPDLSHRTGPQWSIVPRPYKKGGSEFSFTPASPSTSQPSCLFILLITMCRWRQVRHIYRRCGHAETLPPVEIQCGSTHCKFSPNHPRGCVPPSTIVHSDLQPSSPISPAIYSDHRRILFRLRPLSEWSLTCCYWTGLGLNRC